MPHKKSLPDHAMNVSTYNELAEFARAFAAGQLNLLFLFGNPGLGKSRHIRDAVGCRVGWIEGNATPFGIYTAAFEHRDQPIILDDVDGLYRDRNGVRLLKSLCQTDLVKSLAWQSQAAALEKRGIPRQFTTTSRVVIIANQWQSLNADVAALEDRGHIVHFDPSPLEVHKQAATWFWDQEVFDFVAEHLHVVERPSLRTYALAWELKAAGMDWKAAVLSRCLTGTALEVAKLKADPGFASEEDRVRAFVDRKLGCRTSYFNHTKKLRPAEPVPPIIVQHTAPPSASSPLDMLKLLEPRFGRLGNG